MPNASTLLAATAVTASLATASRPQGSAMVSRSLLAGRANPVGYLHPASAIWISFEMVKLENI